MFAADRPARGARILTRLPERPRVHPAGNRDVLIPAPDGLALVLALHVLAARWCDVMISVGEALQPDVEAAGEGVHVLVERHPVQRVHDGGHAGK